MSRRVLVIDDNPALARIIAALLTRHGFNVSVAAGPDEALRALADSSFDAIVSDVVMPGQDGFALGRRIRENPATARTPIVYLTSLDSIEDEFEGYLSGGDAWVTKPFRARDLLDQLERVLSGAKAPAAGRRVLAAGPARVIGAVTGPRSVLLQQACNVTSYWLESEPELESALARADRETFDLLVCEYLPGSDVVGMVKAFLEHFALNLPALFLLERATGRTTATGPMHALILPVSAHELAARMDEIMRGQTA